MKRQALGWIVGGSLLISGHLAAQPLSDLNDRLEAMRSDRPIRVKMDVELRHKGSAPLHLNDNKRKGAAIVTFGPRGIDVREKWTRGSSSKYSVWRSQNEEEIVPLVDQAEARDLIDAAGTIANLLSEAVLVSDERTIWQGRPARLLTFAPARMEEDVEAVRTLQKNDPTPFGELKLWLDESGAPIALERTMDFGIGRAVDLAESQTVTFQQVDGRLLAATSESSYSGTALAVLRGRDTKKVKVTVVK